MIITASRRTDIPAFYTDWFMRRVREGFCLVPNPYHPEQVSRVSLAPEDVDVLIFCTKDARPLLPHLPELDERGYRYYFQYTLNVYGPELEFHVPPLPERIETFRQVSEHVGPDRIIWRYDPIIISNHTRPGFHRTGFGQVASALSDCCRRVVVSLVDFYRKTDRRLRELEAEGWEFERAGVDDPETRDLLVWMARCAEEQGLVIESCAENGLSALGIKPGRCVDDRLIEQLWGLHLHKKNPSQRAACGCAVSRDIGMNDTCLHGCRYCYATRTHALAERAYVERHDPSGPALLKGFQVPTTGNKTGVSRQLRLL